MGKKTPFYRWGKNPTVIPHLSLHRAVLPLGPAVVPLELCTKAGKKGQGGGGPRAVLVTEVERYYRSGVVLSCLLPLLLPPNLAQEATLTNRGSTSAEQEQYCRLWPRVVLPL